MLFNEAPRGRAHAWVRNHIVGLVALCVAMSGTAVAASDSGKNGPEASAAVVSDKKFKKLRRKVNDLEDQVAALGGRPSPLIPTTLPPSGPAGGGLTGTYPNPLIGPNAVSGAEVADDTLGRADIGPGGVGPAEISDNIVVRAANVVVPFAGTVANGQYDTENATASCLPGEDVISGGATWVGGPFADAELTLSEIVVFGGSEQVRATGGNDSGTSRTLQVHAYCLN